MVAQAERRLTRRLNRYWGFLILSYFLGILIFVYYAAIHALLSSFSASVGIINPHYLVTSFGLVYLGLFSIGIVFFSFDVRARDERDRIVDVMDCRPLTNFELLAGRCLGLFLVSWIPLVVMCILLQGLGWLLPQIGSPIGDTIEPVSLFAFAGFMAIPSILFTITMVFLITLLVKNRLLSALVSLAVLGGMFWLVLSSSYEIVPLFDFMGLATTEFPSDLLPGVSWGFGWLQRLGILFLSFGLLGFATMVHPRLDGGDLKRTGIVSSSVFAVGVVIVVFCSQAQRSVTTLFNEWRVAHEEKVAEPIVDIISIDGNVFIDPGRSLQVELTMQFKAPATSAISTALFSLNPGMEVEEVTSVNGQPLNVTHNNGLLEIELESLLSAGESTSITFTLSGEPNMEFAYLDTNIEPENILQSNSQILLGYKAGIFDSRFVALMPGIYWYPQPGVDISRDDTRARPRDFFLVELDVELPASWLVAGPGESQEINSASTQGMRRVHFSPEVEIDQVALIAAEFTKYETEINDINFEVLMYPEHLQNFEVLAPLHEDIEEWIATRLQLVADAGLVYPFNTFSLVEVPNQLRGYVGGWRMDTSMALPSMMLMRESGFPSSRFDFYTSFTTNTAANGTTSSNISIGSESLTNVDLDRLTNFFINDLTGGNIFSGAARSFFSSQTAATGEEAVALNFVMENLANLVFSNQQSYFSMYDDINAILTNVLETVLTGQSGQSVLEATIANLNLDQNVWDSAMSSSLAELDPEADPELTIRLLTLKGGQLAQAIYDTLGVQGTGEILASILSEHRGDSYTMADVLAVLNAKNPGLASMFEEIMYSNELPGFVVDEVELYRLSDDDSGNSRYQLTVAVRNDEDVAGFTRIGWLMAGDGNQFYKSETIKIDAHSAVEYGVVLSAPPLRAMVEPYLSINRTSIVARAFPEGLDLTERNVVEFAGVRDIPWDDTEDRLIIDDLDSAVYVIDTDVNNGLRLTSTSDDSGKSEDSSGILANEGTAPRDWTRIDSSSGWGKYRHTYTTILLGEGNKKVVMPLSIPSAGLWDLELHMPIIPPARVEQYSGVWRLELVTANGREMIEFDNTAAVSGWNLIGQYDLPAGEVSIEVRNDGTAAAIVADAFAWSQ